MVLTLLVGLAVMGLWWWLVKLKQKYFRGREMFGYFEYSYGNDKGSSREYGAMLELDCVGAMEYRRECGAQITFEFFDKSADKVEDMIDKRYHVEQQQSVRRGR